MTIESDSDGQYGRSVKVDWDAALQEHQRWLRTIVYARLQDAEAVDEVMQEVALAAVRQSAPLMDATKVAPWLYRLAIRHVLMYRRRCGRRRKLMYGFGRLFRPTESNFREPEPLDWLLADERRDAVRSALERLRDQDRELLLLKYTEEWKYQQIAEHLGITETAVEARLHRARKRLRRELTAEEIVSTNR